MRRFSCMLVVVSVFLVVFGIQSIVDGLTYKSPKSITYEQLIQQKPTAGWFSISGGFLSVAEGAHTYKQGHTSSQDEITEVYVPLQDARLLKGKLKSADDRIHVLVYTSKNDAVQMYNDLKNMPAPKAGEEFDYTKYAINRNVQAMIATSLHSIKDEDEKAIRKAMPELAEDCIMLNEGATPAGVGTGVGMVIGGLVLGGIMLLVMVASRRTN